jgi:hypothetical protein
VIKWVWIEIFIKIDEHVASPRQAFAEAARYAENAANSQITFAKATRYATQNLSRSVQL